MESQNESYHVMYYNPDVSLSMKICTQRKAGRRKWASRVFIESKS